MKTYPNPYVNYLVEFHATRDFFECHELLEEYWKQHPNDNKSEAWVGFIQLAVGQYHERRGNRKGAAKMYGQSLLKLRKLNKEGFGLDIASLLKQLDERLAAVSQEGNSDYNDINIKIIDQELMNSCLSECQARGLQWGAPSPLGDDQLIHRHRLRDRSDVIAARLEAMAAKKRRGFNEDRQ